MNSNPLNAIMAEVDIVKTGINLGKIACNDPKVYNMIMAKKEPSGCEMEYLAKKCEDAGVPINNNILNVPKCIDALGDNITCQSKNLLNSNTTFWIMFVLLVVLVALILSSEIGMRVWNRMKRDSGVHPPSGNPDDE
jgi:hypothetical protein